MHGSCEQEQLLWTLGSLLAASSTEGGRAPSWGDEAAEAAGFQDDRRVSQGVAAAIRLVRGPSSRWQSRGRMPS